MDKYYTWGGIKERMQHIRELSKEIIAKQEEIYLYEKELHGISRDVFQMAIQFAKNVTIFSGYELSLLLGRKPLGMIAFSFPSNFSLASFYTVCPSAYLAGNSLLLRFSKKAFMPSF